MAYKLSKFQTHPYLQNRWKQVGRKLAFSCKNNEEFSSWRNKTIRKLKELTGFNSMLPVNLLPKITEEIVFKEYIRQRVEIQTEPGVVMPFFVLIPKDSSGPFPVVLAPHGHAGGGKVAVAGCKENDEVAKAILKYNYDYGVQFVRAGFITFCPDARGFGERQEEKAKGNIKNNSCQLLNNMGYPLGQTVTGMWTWDMSRLIDYVETRKDCLVDKIGCAGLSGGGLQTLWISAFDKRIKCAVVSGYFYGYKESLLDGHGNCACNYVPHLYEYVDMGDIAALIAPRPLMIETGTNDELNGASGLANVKSQVRLARKAYQLLQANPNLKHDIFNGGHQWSGFKAIPWMQYQLKK